MPIIVAMVQINVSLVTTAALFVSLSSGAVGVVVGVLDVGATDVVVVKLSVLLQNPGVSNPHKFQ